MSTTNKNQTIKISKDNLIKLNEYLNKRIFIKFNGGRQVFGQLKSYDRSLNLIIDNSI